MEKDVAAMGPHSVHRTEVSELWGWRSGPRTGNIRVRHRATCAYGKQVVMESHFFSKPFPQRMSCHGIPLASLCVCELRDSHEASSREFI